MITADGKPFAVMIDLTGSDDLEDVLLMITPAGADDGARHPKKLIWRVKE